MTFGPGVEAVILDCDGVLVDSARSYDAAIPQVATSLLDRLAGVKTDWRGTMPRLIETLRLTGGFNNDWDSTYALVMFAAMSASNTDPKKGRSRSMEVADLALVGEYVDRVRGLGLTDGAKAVDAVVAGADARTRVRCAELKRSLGYPGIPPRSTLASAFDEAYLGAALYRKVYGAEPRYNGGSGLIDREKVLVNERTLRRLRSAYDGRVALVTGRLSEAANYTLGRLMQYLDHGSSIFIGDSALGGARGRNLAKYSKPSPLGLIEVMKRLKAKTAAYVGDEGEDVLMAEEAKKLGEVVFFAGVCRGEDAQIKERFFLQHGADAIIHSVNELPDALT